MNKHNENAAHRLQQWPEAIWLLIALLTPLLVNLWVEQQFEASKIWLLRTLIWLLALFWFGGLLLGLQIKPLSIPIRNLCGALLLVVILATALSDAPAVAIHGSLERAHGALTTLSFLLLFLCVATQLDAQRSRLLLQTIILTAVPICLIGLLQAAGWQPLPLSSDARSPIVTTLGRANFSGAYLASLLPLTLNAAALAAAPWRRRGYWALAALELGVIALTQARAAWIAAAVGLGLFFWLRAAPRWSLRNRRLSALGGLAALGGPLLLLLQRALAGSGSLAARWTIWQAALRLLWPRLWLGYGADTLELIFPAVYPPQLVYYQGRGVVVDRAHNWLLDWSLNYGIVATLLFSALVFLILRAGWQLLARHDAAAAAPGAPARDTAWLAACMAALIAHLVGNLFLFDVAATATVFWLLLAVVYATTTPRTWQAVHWSVPHRVRPAIVTVLVIGVGWAVWQWNVRPLQADVHSWRGTQALQRGETANSLAEYEAAVAIQPQRAAYHVAVGLTAAQLGASTQAEAALHAAIALRPTDPVLYTHLAAVFAAQGPQTADSLGQAYAALEQAIALAPTIALTYQQYADLALRAGDLALAGAQAEQALNLDATDGTSFGILGWVQLQRGDLAAAQQAFEQAVTWRPNAANFHLGLATVFFQQGQFEAARRAVAQSLLLDAAYAPALALQIQLQGK